jgi:hypothetical protein
MDKSLQVLIQNARWLVLSEKQMKMGEILTYKSQLIVLIKVLELLSIVTVNFQKLNRASIFQLHLTKTGLL